MRGTSVTRPVPGGRPREQAALEAQRLAAELARTDAELRRAQERLEALTARMADDLRLAGTVQRGLLPGPVEHTGLDVAREFLPFGPVGGDYYDFLPLPDGRVAFALGDVMGKGIAAALLAAGLKAAVHAQLQGEELPPEEVVRRVNRLFREVAPANIFASLFFAVFDVGRGQVEYVNAGHDYPFRVRGTGEVDDLAAGGALLGLTDDARYERVRTRLEREDVLVFFTDGVTDRTGAHGEGYGTERLKEAARRSHGDTARIVLYSLLGDVQGFSEGGSAQDDATLVVVRVR